MQSKKLEKSAGRTIVSRRKIVKIGAKAAKANNCWRRKRKKKPAKKERF